MSVPHLLAADAMSTGRLGASIACLIGLTGVIVGGVVLARPGRTSRAVVALAAGLIGLALGALVVATSDGGIGTGNGRGGAHVALMLGLIATVLGGLGLARARRKGGTATGAATADW